MWIQLSLNKHCSTLTCLVQQKICIYSESCLHRPVLVQLSHDLLLLGGEAVRAFTWGRWNHGGIASVTEPRWETADKIRLDAITKMFVLWIGRWVSINALLLTLGGLLRPMAGWTGSIDVMLAGSDAVGSAACQVWVELQGSGLTFTAVSSSSSTYRLLTHTVLLSPDLSLSRTPRQSWDNHRNICTTRESITVLLMEDCLHLIEAQPIMQLLLKAPCSHFTVLGLADYPPGNPFYAPTLPRLPGRLTPCHIRHSRTVGLQQRSPGRSCFHCGYTAGQIWLQLLRRPVGNCEN